MRPGLYNDNTRRHYPFQEGTAFLPHSAVVDCGFRIGPNTGFDAAVHYVALRHVLREGDLLTFIFESSAPGLFGRQLRFIRDITDEPYALEYVDSMDNQPDSVSSSVSHTCDYVDDFSGFLVTGPLAELLESLPGDGVLSGELQVEPALLQELGQTYARSLNVANGDRTRYETPEGCREQCWPYSLQPLYVRGTCLQGPIRFQEGYNLSITQSTDENLLTFDAVPGAGDGEVCEQVPVFDEEEPPDDSLFLEGGPACNEVIRSINGAGGPIVPITGGLGVRVTSVPAESRIIVNVDTLDMAVCSTQTDENDVSASDCPSVSATDDPCACGPE